MHPVGKALWYIETRLAAEISLGQIACFAGVSRYHLLRAYGFADTFLDAGGEDSAATFTFHGFDGERYWAANHHMAGRIDWILTLDGASSVQTKACVIVRDAEPPFYPSDHYPVVADLDLGAQ